MDCNFCKEETKPNDQNEVKLNCAKYMLCEKCYENLCSLFDIYNGSGKKLESYPNGIKKEKKRPLERGGKFLGIWIGA